MVLIINSIYKFLVFFVTIILSISILGCEEQAEFKQQNYPIIQTNQVTEIDKSGAVFSGEFLQDGINKTIDHGFVWSRDQKPTLSNFKLSLGSDVQSMVTAMVKYDLIENMVYYVRAYATTVKDTVYGNSVQFKSLGSSYPVINSINPTEGIDGDTLTIEGENFWTLQSFNFVSIGAIGAKIIKATNTQLKVIVPNMPSAKPYEINVSTNRKSTTSSVSFAVQNPVITSFTPVSGKAGTTVTIIGDYFSKDFTSLYLNGLRCIILQQSRHALVVQTPLYPYVFGDAKFTVGVNGKSSVSEMNFFVERP